MHRVLMTQESSSVFPFLPLKPLLPFLRSKIINMADNSQSNPLTKRNFSKVIISLENILLPREKLSPTPSELDGLESEIEIQLRDLGCELIQTSGILLKLPQVRF